MFENLTKKLTLIDCELKPATMAAGNYFDGLDRTEYFPCWRLCVEITCDSHRRIAQAERLIRKCIARYHTYQVRTEFLGHYYIFIIADAADFIRADQLERKKAVFLNAFWSAIHDNPEARADNAAMAISAGRAAVAGMN